MPRFKKKNAITNKQIMIYIQELTMMLPDGGKQSPCPGKPQHFTKRATNERLAHIPRQLVAGGRSQVVRLKNCMCY
jgi:hypothetical protein